MSKLSETSLKLIKRLEELWDDKEFVIGTMSDAHTEEDRVALLDFIEQGENVNIETVSVLAIRLGNRRDKLDKES